MEYKLITERIHLFAPNIHVCFAIEFCGALDIEALREAIKKVMYKYPILRSSVRFDENGHAFFHIVEDVEPEFHIEELTDEKDWISIVAREQKKPFTLDRAPLIRFTCLCNEGKMQMVMCLHHILADGLSCVSILKDIMFFIQNSRQAAEAQKVRLPEDSQLYDGEKLLFLPKLLVNNLNRQWRKSPIIFTEEEYYSMRRNYWIQRSHTIGAVELSSERVSELAAKCHEHNVTINSLLLSSLLMCSYEIDKRNKKAGLAVSIHSDENNFGNFASGISIDYVYDTRKSIWENAVAAQVLVKRKQGNIKLKHFYLTFLKTLDASLIDSMYFSLFDNFNSKPTGNLRKILGYTKIPLGLGATNLGKTDLSVKDGIKSTYFIPPLIANTDKIVGIITTDSGLRVVYQYSDQVNAKENKRIFEAWINMLQGSAL
jgi:NRPS condensation-like uncharacterized protein